MRFMNLSCWLSSLVVLLAASAAGAADVPSRIDGTVHIRFQGESTLHGFTGTAPPQSIHLASDPATGTFTAEIKLPAASLDTDNSWRDAKMHDVLEAEAHPEIVARFQNLAPAALRPKSAESPATIAFDLRLRTVERRMEAKLSNWQETPNTLSFDATFVVSLRSFGLEAPSVAGFVRVDDSIKVEVHVDLARAA